MSTRPGTTSRPLTSIVLNARAGSMWGATAAILPSAMATSRRSLRLLRGSTTWPPRSSRSYLGSAARAGVAAIGRAASRTAATASGLLMAAAFGAPARTEVFAHVQLPRHLVALHLAAEREAQCVAVRFGVAAADLDHVAVDRAAEVPGDEVALMGAVEGAALLPQVQHVPRRGRDVFDVDVPLAAEVGGRSSRHGLHGLAGG